MRDDILLVLAFDGSRPVAGALNFIGRDTLYGRYWGCVEDYPCLHFELCYYQAIDWAIAHGPAAGRGRGAGRTQAGPRLSAGGDAFAALDRRPRFSQGGGRYLEAERRAWAKRSRC
jgi:predicted N-acyltransferase